VRSVGCLHKRQNSSRLHVHWSASKPDRLSQGKVQSQKLPISMQELSVELSLSIRVIVVSHRCSVNFIHVGDCWIKMRFWPCLGRLMSETCFAVK